MIEFCDEKGTDCSPSLLVWHGYVLKYTRNPGPHWAVLPQMYWLHQTLTVDTSDGWAFCDVLFPPVPLPQFHICILFRCQITTEDPSGPAFASIAVKALSSGTLGEHCLGRNLLLPLPLPIASIGKANERPSWCFQQASPTQHTQSTWLCVPKTIPGIATWKS
jgi:hypothetical protein